MYIYTYTHRNNNNKKDSIIDLISGERKPIDFSI